MPRLAPEDARERVSRTLAAWGAPPDVAECVAGHLVEADMLGHPSHGVRQLLRYRGLIDSGEWVVGASPSVVRSEGGLATIDGAGGMGHPALALAVDEAAALARRFGVGACGVVRCGHAGRMGAWAERGAALGMATLIVLAGGEPPFAMAAGPGAEAALHTNPVTLGVPADGTPFVLDMATSAVAGGKVVVAAARGDRLAPGILLDRHGEPTEDPDEFAAGGSLLPAAGYKGFGLSAMIEALSIGMVGADGDGLRPRSGALVICIAGDAFRPADEARASVEGLRARLHDSGSERTVVLAPGELEASRRGGDGIDIDDDVMAIL